MSRCRAQDSRGGVVLLSRPAQVRPRDELVEHLLEVPLEEDAHEVVGAQRLALLQGLEVVVAQQPLGRVKALEGKQSLLARQRVDDVHFGPWSAHRSPSSSRFGAPGTPL